MKQIRTKAKVEVSEANAHTRRPPFWQADPSRVASVSLILGLTMLAFFGVILLLTTLLFALGKPISAAHLPLAALVTAGCAWFITKRFAPEKPLKTFSLVIGVNAIIFVVGLVGLGSFYDLSWDGQTYQQEAIIQLTNGWNPLRDTPLSTIHEVWINHYPKAPWIFAATVYKLTGDLENGKVFNAIFFFMTAFFYLAALLTFRPNGLGKAALLSLVVALNPVFVNQLLSYYIDCQIAGFLLSAIALCYLAYSKQDKLLALALVLAIILLVNTKFTAIVYVLVLTGGLAGWLFCAKQRRGARTVLLIGAGGLLVGLLVVGFNPYVSNTLSKGHPFYPLAGKGAVDIWDPATSQSMELPVGFRQANSFKKLFVSLFTYSENPGFKKPRYKIPFTYEKNELLWFAEKSDLRLGGMGPLFSGVLVLTVLMALILTAELRKQKDPLVLSIFGVTAIIFVSVLANPESWWARYVPQLWLVPVLLALPGIYLINKKSLKLLGWAIILVLLVNSSMILWFYLHAQCNKSYALEQQLTAIVEIQREFKQPVLVDFRGFYSSRVRLENFGITYREVTSPPAGAKQIPLIGSRAITYLMLPNTIPQQ